MPRHLSAFWLHTCGLPHLELGQLLWWLVLMCLLLARSVGTAVLLVRFRGMGIPALPPTLVSLTPMAMTTMTTKVATKVAAKVVAKVVQCARGA